MAKPLQIQSSLESNDTPLLINTFNLRRHVRYETNAIARSLAPQQPHVLKLGHPSWRFAVGRRRSPEREFALRCRP